MCRSEVTAHGVCLLLCESRAMTEAEWLTGGVYGPEGGIVGIGFRFAVIAAVLVWSSRRMPTGIAQNRPQFGTLSLEDGGE